VSLETVLEGADVMFLLTNHHDYQTLIRRFSSAGWPSPSSSTRAVPWTPPGGARPGSAFSSSDRVGWIARKDGDHPDGVSFAEEDEDDRLAAARVEAEDELLVQTLPERVQAFKSHSLALTRNGHKNE